MTAIRRTMLHHIWKVTAVLAAAFGVAVLSSAAPASADTLINQPPARVCHHHTFTVGVWAQPGTPWANRRYVVNVYNPSRVRVQHHAGHAPTSAWRYWHPKAWKLDKGTLALRVLPGYLHAKNNNARNVLLRPLPRSDKPLAVEVFVQSEPKAQFEHAGIVWYQDDDNYVSLFQEVLGGKVDGGGGNEHVKSAVDKRIFSRLVVARVETDLPAIL